MSLPQENKSLKSAAAEKDSDRYLNPKNQRNCTPGFEAPSVPVLLVKNKGPPRENNQGKGQRKPTLLLEGLSHNSGSERNTSGLIKDMGRASGSRSQTLKYEMSLKKLLLY